MVKKVAGKLTKKDKYGQGYTDWAAESLGMRHRGEKTKGKMTLADRVRMMKGMDKALKARGKKLGDGVLVVAYSDSGIKKSGV